jgi:hypothetical protein
MWPVLLRSTQQKANAASPYCQDVPQLLLLLLSQLQWKKPLQPSNEDQPYALAYMIAQRQANVCSATKYTSVQP